MLALLAAILVLVPRRNVLYSFVSTRNGQASHEVSLSRTARHAGLPGMGSMSMEALEEMMKDPEKLKQFQEQMDQVMKDPEKKKMIESMGQQMQSAVEKLKEDPEMKEFFEDIEKNGPSAMKRWENNEMVLSKFSKATGGPQGLAAAYGMAPPGGAAAPPPKPVFKFGDEVIITGLQKAPELNGKKAMVVPPTPEEQKNLEGTGRMIVRLLDTGAQFAVKPDNLRTTRQEADAVLGSSLENVSLYNPAIQSEAAKLRESGKLQSLQEDPELKPIFEDIKKNGIGALNKYWEDAELMAKISKAMGER